MMASKSVIVRLAALLAFTLTPAIISSPTFGNEVGVNYCGRQEVLDLVLQHFDQQTAHLDLVASTATEILTGRDRILCAVTVRVELHGNIDADSDPIFIVQHRYYAIRPLTGGLSIDFGGH